MRTTSWIEISKSALQSNLNFIKKYVGQHVEISSVVKGNAYGHGIESFCPLLYELGQKYFSVFNAHEAYRVFNSIGEKDLNIMIMGCINDEQLEWAIENNISFYVFNLERLEKSMQLAKKKNKKAKVHIEFETGMNRTGFNHNILKHIYEFLKNNSKNVEVQGVCSHLAGAESINNYKRIQEQIKIFRKIKRNTDKWKLPNNKYHLSCSAGILSYPKQFHDLVRIGMLQYGFFPNQETLVQYFTKHKVQKDPLKRVLTWKSRVMDIKDVKIGEFIGYGTSFLTNKASRIATIPVGYADGFSRNLSNNGKVLINGDRFSVIGMVNMNMAAVNITKFNNIKIGDEVVLIGKQGDYEISVRSFSDFSNSVNYELLTRLPQNINRKITS